VTCTEDPRPVCPRCQTADRVILPGEPGLEAADAKADRWKLATKGELDTNSEGWWRKQAKKGEARAWEEHHGAFCDSCMKFVGVPI